MSQLRHVAVVVGSLRRESFSRKLAQVLATLTPPSVKLSIVEIRDLPLYDEDLETADPPAAWTTFRRAIGAADAVLFVTPEYNRSMPAALKNAIDVGSRPWGKSVWKGKPAAVASISIGTIGGFGANHHLRQALMVLDVPVLPTPEVYLGNVSKVFAADGTIESDGVRTLLTQFVTAFAGWIETHLHKAT